jgi:peptidoglycan/xylan/chitin deacetylase (PgdA/CDA1 family)
MHLRTGRKVKTGAALAAALLVVTPLLGTSPSAAVTVSNLTARTNTPDTILNLRSCASTSCQVLRRVPHGTLLSMTAASGDWFRTTYSGATGWVHSRYTILQGTPATTVSRGNTSRKMVSYTFDAGSDLGFAKSILDFLKANGIKASFGMTGTWATANPSYVQRMVDEGHHIINHTWSHPSFTGVSASTTALTPARRTEQLVLLNNKVVSLTGKSTKPYFRPPYGDYNSGVLRDVGANGYSRNVMWSVDTLGWNGLTATQICNRVISSVDNASSGGNGYIVLMHVGAASQDANALSCMTKALKSRGFGFGTVPQVIAP